MDRASAMSRVRAVGRDGGERLEADAGRHVEVVGQAKVEGTLPQPFHEARVVVLHLPDLNLGVLEFKAGAQFGQNQGGEARQAADGQGPRHAGAQVGGEDHDPFGLPERVASRPDDPMPPGRER
jgi:hypothetical protein